MNINVMVVKFCEFIAVFVLEYILKMIQVTATYYETLPSHLYRADKLLGFLLQYRRGGMSWMQGEVEKKQVVTALVMSNVAEVLDVNRVSLPWLDMNPLDSQVGKDLDDDENDKVGEELDNNILFSLNMRRSWILSSSHG